MDQKTPETRFMEFGISLGLLLGAAVGITLWLLTEQFVFFPIFVGSGLTVGVAVGASIDQQIEDEEKKDRRINR